ncbi:hypothetical protein F5X96DRAFT_672253 [Biscogniauxia mediterranea]|nr:hypothetical protein F5X96DRAFT_672253 [Biscogniauxia mediterranea]
MEKSIHRQADGAATMDSFLQNNDVFVSSSGSSSNGDANTRFRRKRTVMFKGEPEWTDRLDGMTAEYRMLQMKNEELKAEIQVLREALDEATSKGPDGSPDSSTVDADDVSELLSVCMQHAKLAWSDIDPAYVGAQRVLHLIKVAIAKLEGRIAGMAGEVARARKTEGAFHGLTWAQLRLTARCESLEEKCRLLELAKQDLEREVACSRRERLKYGGGGGGRGAEAGSTSTSNNSTTATASTIVHNNEDDNTPHNHPPPSTPPSSSPSPTSPTTPPRWSYGPPRGAHVHGEPPARRICRAAAVYRRDAEALCAANMGLLHVNGELWERLRRIRAAAEKDDEDDEDLRELIFGLVDEDDEDEDEEDGEAGEDEDGDGEEKDGEEEVQKGEEAGGDGDEHGVREQKQQ